nr:hypothetical protein [Tanacetum cinerariifolium]
MTRTHRAIDTGDPEVLVQFAGFEAEEDEWVNVRKNVRQRKERIRLCGILLPTTTQSKPRGVEVVAAGEGMTNCSEVGGSRY